jgi:hypothetical protein
MPVVTLSSDAWTELNASGSVNGRVRVRTVEASPPVWLVDAAAAPAGAEPDADADAELLDDDKREARIGNSAPGFKVWGRVRGRGLVNRVIVSARIEG